MSEMKSYIGPHPTDHTLTEYYLKSEADKVIAEKDDEIATLKDKLRHYPIMAALLESDKREIAELKKEKEYTLEHTTEVINAQEKELRHQKYRRCLAMAEWCHAKYDEEDARINGCGASWEYISIKMKYWERWRWRWDALAEKFKEAK